MNDQRRLTGHPDRPDLSALDCANTDRGNRAHTPAAQNLLTHILTTPRTQGSDIASPAVRTRADRGWRQPARGAARRWILPAAAAVAAAAVATPALTGNTGRAFASWTPTPLPVSAAQASSHQSECLAAGPDPQGEVTAALTEQRGDFTFTLVATERAVGNCMLLSPELVPDDGIQERGANSWDSAGTPPAPTPKDVSVQWGATFHQSAAGTFTSATGRVGADVVAVQITPDGHQPLEASVGDGYFIAWWPGEPSDHLTVTATTTDGTTTTRALQSGEN